MAGAGAYSMAEVDTNDTVVHICIRYIPIGCRETGTDAVRCSFGQKVLCRRYIFAHCLAVQIFGLGDSSWANGVGKRVCEG